MSIPEIRLAIVIRTELAYGRGVTRGIAEYAQRYPNWRLHAMVAYDMLPPEGWVADAGIGHLPPADWHGLVPENAPRVYIGYHAPPGAARVLADERAIGATGAEHLIRLGFRNHCFIGGMERRAGFVEVVEAANLNLLDVPEPIRGTDPTQWSEPFDVLVDWLKAAPKPLGVMAMHDINARNVSLACRLAGLRVPDDVAILGVDNDELLCDLSDPPLSSVEQGLRQIGYEAGQLIDRMLRGEPSQVITVPPRRVVPRRSTDVLAIDDPEVAEAIRFIRNRSGEDIAIDQIAEAVALNRRSLERRFAKATGHSLHTEIVQTRVGRAREMLSVTDRPLLKIAKSCGFNSLKNFHEVFKRQVGDTPAAYRRKHRMV
ncbi:MAG: substrate-binding domain-containing protein [Planctomycetota bacterium]